MSKSGQISVEYMIIIGLSFIIIIPAGYFFYSYSQTSNDGSIRLQVNQLGSEILKNTESIYGLAEGSLLTLDLKYPNNIRNIYVLNQSELIIRYELTDGMNDAVFFSKVPLSGYYNMSGINCTIPCENSTFSTNPPRPGKHNLKLESKTSYVLISNIY